MNLNGFKNYFSYQKLKRITVIVCVWATVFTAPSAVMRLHVVRPSVCPSVCPSVTIRYRDHIRWNTSKIISRPNSLRSMRSSTPNMGDLVQREHPQNWGWIGVVSGAHKTCHIPETEIGPKLLLRTNRKSHTRFRLAPNLSTLDDLERPKCPSFRNRKVLREVAAPTRNNWLKIDTNCQRENVDEWF